VVNATHWRLSLRERDSVPLLREAGWAPELVWKGVENLTFREFDSYTKTVSNTGNKFKINITSGTYQTTVPVTKEPNEEET